MKLSILIINFNSGWLTKTCVESVMRQELKMTYEIIVVDNHSEDESISLLRSEFPEIKVFDNKKNVGLAAGVNLGIRQASGEMVLLLNPDVVALPKSIEKLVDYLDKQPKVGMVGGKLLSPNGKLQYSCHRFYNPLTIIYRRTWLGRTKQGRVEVARFLMKDYDHDSPRRVDWLMGACLLLRRQAVDLVGGMDERFFLYFEDVDWCRRFWEKNWQVVYLPEAKFSHYHQRTSQQGGWIGILTNGVTRQHIKSAIRYFIKYLGKPVPVSQRKEAA